MERPRNHDDIATALAEMRPAPRAEFAAELDQWAAAGFPRASQARRLPLAGLASRMRSLAPRRLAFTAAGAALTAIVVATMVVASNDSGSRRSLIALEQPATVRPGGVRHSETVPRAARGSVESSAESAGNASSPRPTGGSPLLQLSSVVPFSRQAGGRLAHRDIERSAEIGLLADPADVASDSAEVFAAVHDARGIVLRSTTTAGRNAGARFDLLIPSARLGDALAAFSAIDEVRTRHEATADITKPTVSLEEMLRDSRAKVGGLLAQLAAAETETEREAIEVGLRRERHHGAVLRARLSKLRDRADFSRVSLRIETDSSAATGGAWGVDDAFEDAGHILGIAVGVTLVGLAVLAPLALLSLLAWLVHRAWLRAARARALDA